jgi:ATP-dependent Clp protease, protease subunit
MNVIPFPKAKGPWFEIKNKTEESVDLYLYDVIGDDWVGSDAATVVKQISAITSNQINLRINSPGGSVFDGFAIFNALHNHKATVTTYIDGLAASIASIIALAGDKVVMAENAMVMIHNPWTFSMGESKDLRKDADILDQLKESLITAYVNKTEQSREDIAAAMDNETWYSSEDAKKIGLVDEVKTGMKAAACASPELLSQLGYGKIPENLPVAETPEPVITPSTAPRSLYQRKLALLEKLNP